MSERIAKKVLVIGWDAAEWGVITPLLDAGKMPAFQKLVENGVVGNIATLYPPLSPMLWTSVATGKYADKHGILGFTEPNPDAGGIRPVTGSSRKVKAIWNILHYHGLKSNVIDWWPSHPAEPINGAMVSNFYKTIGKIEDNSLMDIPGTIHPPELAEVLNELRVHPVEFGSDIIKPFVPTVTSLDPKKHKVPIEHIAKTVAQMSSIQAASTWLMRNTEWDFMAVYFDAIDHFSHSFMKYHPPMLNGIDKDYYETYKEVINGAYIFHDMMLERLLELAGEDTTVILLSDHGFYSNHMRMVSLPRFNTAPAIEHNPYGVLCASGPGIKKDERIYGSTLLDITPTILAMLGLPIGRDMDGKVLTEMFENEIHYDLIDSWEEVKGDFGTYQPHEIEDTLAGASMLKQLVELGYIEDPGEDKNRAMEQCIAESKFNLASVYMRKNNYPEALPLLEEIVEQYPDNNPFNLSITECYLALEMFDEATKTIERVRETKESHIPNLDIMEGIIASRKGENEKALECFKRVKESDIHSPRIYLELGRIYNKTQQFYDAMSCFQKALEMDEENAQAFLGLGISLLRLGRHEEAADKLLSSIGLIYHFAPAHFHLGEALFYLKKYKESSDAFEVCLTMAPKQRKAHQWLYRIYSSYLPDETKAKYHQSFLEKHMHGEIIVVSGLPRSGTSLMMQMLDAGGQDLLVDDKRPADENNPRGYWEYEPVKNLGRDNSWMHLAEDKGVKIIAQLLQFLPHDYHYKIIFMQRDIAEIIQSQQIMLGKPSNVYPMELVETYKKVIEKIKVWSASQPNVEIQFINFKDLFERPNEIALQISGFLEEPLKVEEMVKKIDPHLYRNKKI